MLPRISDAYAAFRGTDTILTPHVGGSRGNLEFHEPGLEPAVEIASGHGTFEWFFHEALERRYQLGVVGGSDSHTGRPGDDQPGFQVRRYAKAALTALYTERLDLPGVFDALASRRVAVTPPRAPESCSTCRSTARRRAPATRRRAPATRRARSRTSPFRSRAPRRSSGSSCTAG
ncbi:MAG: hypothetical protein FJ038_02015 [Chloroflexi bacterium]|nr:hypothetical protein [Chloroflexota bacterium]